MATFLFDLDMTLVDSSPVESLRNKRLWRQVDKNLHLIRPMASNSKVAPHNLPAELKKKGHKVGIVTSSKRKYAEKVVGMFNITNDVLVAYGDTDEHKPDPEPIEHAMAQLKAKPKDTYYVGDDEVDVQASYRASVTSIGAAWGARGWPQINTAPDILVYDTKILLNEKTLSERPFIGDFMSHEVRWHHGSILHHPDGSGFSLGRYFVTSDPRHGESFLSRAILDLKNGDDHAEDLGEMLGEALLNSGVTDTDFFLVPVPPKPKQTRNRYEELISHTFHYLDQYSCCYPYPDGLKCVRDYGDLKEKGWGERQLAVRGAFRSQYEWKGDRVVLLDDVSTTGATADACARCLYRDGAREVIKVSLAKDQQRFVGRDCPACGSQLRIRTNHHTGERFWGCSAYRAERCRYTESLTD